MIPASPLTAYGRLERKPQNTKKRICIALVLTALVVSVGLVGISVGIFIGRKRSYGNGDGWKSGLRAIDLACSTTLYPTLCVSTLVSFPGVERANRKDFAHITVNVTKHRVQDAYSTALVVAGKGMDPKQRVALNDCMELLEDSMDHLNVSLSKIANMDVKSMKRQIADVQTLLSAAMTNQDTCLEGFSEAGGYVNVLIQESSRNLSELVSNSLALLKVSFPENGMEMNDFRVRPHGGGRRLLDWDDGYPPWLSAGDRRLLQMRNATIMAANAVVAKDGSGKYKTIADAVADAPFKSSQRYIIYVKAGLYNENVTISRKKTNIMIIGDGRGKTIVSAGRNVKEGSTTFRSATFAASGKGFIAMDMTFINVAGPTKHQAVALRVSADFSAIYHCAFAGYQDTLYVHSLRQFYRECDIFGTVDFIFGNAAVVLQNCNIYPRKPMPNQKNTITAQNRKDPHQTTGISIHNCKVLPSTDLAPVKATYPTFLGRPWKQYSRVVYMQTFMGDLIDPRGWLEWAGNFALSTLYYGEYSNSGPGARLDGRVTWPGYHILRTPAEANNFTVANFISGTSWLPSTGIAFIGGLLN